MGAIPQLGHWPCGGGAIGAGGAALRNLTTFAVNSVPHTNGQTINLADGVTSATVAATNGGSISALTGNTGLTTGNNVCTFTVTAEDGVTTLDVTLNLHVLLPAPTLESVTLDNNSPTAGDQITATLLGTNIVTSIYFFKADGVEVQASIAASYTVTRSDMGKVISCTAICSNETGSTGYVNSAPTAAVTAIPLNTAAPVATSSGTNPANPGDTISTTNGTWSAYPAPTFTYFNTGFNGGTVNNVLADVADVGTGITFAVTADNNIGSPGAADSNTVTVIMP